MPSATVLRMRIIAGEFRGRNLLPPESDTTRPITDRAKQSVFDILSPLIEGAVVYDCFAGTGSMGLECLSRGAAAAVFFEGDRSALALLKQNIAALKVTERAKVVPGDLFRWFESGVANKPTDLIFLDPPYRMLVESPDPLRRLANRMVTNHLSATGNIIFRHDGKDELSLDPLLVRADQREYGGMMVEFLQRGNTTGAGT